MADEQSTTGQEAATPKKKVVKIPVQMKDGSTVEFNQKQKVVKTVGDSSVRFDFSNGETREVTADLGGLTSRFALHGISQKFGDEGAGVESVDDILYGFDELYDRLSKGEWTEKREGGGLGGISILAKALVEVTGKTAEDVRAFLKGLSPAEKIAMRQAPELKPTIDRLEAEKSQDSKVDVGALLARISG